MPSADRRADVDWEGELLTGGGEVSFSSSEVGRFPVTWASRVESPDGRTSPEELLAAAHSSCFAMSLSAALTRGGTPPERLHVTSVVAVRPKEGGGIRVTASALEVTGAVPGMDGPAFQEAAVAAEKGCPISNAIRDNVEITVTAALEG